MDNPFIDMCKRKGDGCSERVSECLLQVLQAAFRHIMAEIFLFESGKV